MALNTVQALLLALGANRLQELEDALFTVIDPLSDPTFVAITGDLLDKVGARVGEDRQGRGDTDYQAAIRLRIRVNRSRGKAEDIVQIAILAAVNSLPKYYEFPDHTCVFEVDITNLPGAAQVAKLLGQAKPVGVRGLLVYSSDASTVGQWGDSVQPSPLVAANTWGDAVGATGPVFASGVALVSS